MNSAVAVLCLCLLAAQGYAMQLGWGDCDVENVKVVSNFDAASYMGHWYEIEAYSQIWEFGGKCSTADYALGDDGKVNVTNSMQTLVGAVSQEGFAVVTSDNGDARLSVTFNVPLFGERKANYLVLATDYNNYAVVYSCSKLGFFKAESAWILGRNVSLSEEDQDTVEKVIKESKLKRKAFRPTKQDC